jgi:hypothetical protein
MKNSVLSSTSNYVHDNKEFIINNVADYLLLNVQNEEFGYYFYLSDDEIYEYENATSYKRNKTRIEIEKFIVTNFNYNINLNSKS